VSSAPLIQRSRARRCGETAADRHEHDRIRRTSAAGPLD
jgi:hypothetical protein